MKKIIICIFAVIVGFLCTSCEKEKSNESFIIRWAVVCSSDLLDYVTPIVSFTDESGNRQEVSITDNDWNKSDIIQLGDSKNYITLQNVEGYYWAKNLNFNSFGVRYNIEVRYNMKDNTKIDVEKAYQLNHGIICLVNTSSDNSFFTNSNTTIAIDKKKGDEVEAYIGNLINTSDKREISVDSKGEITIK